MRCRFLRTPALRPPLGLEAFEVRRAVVDEGHRLGERPVPRDLGDRPVHLLCDPPVRRVALGPRAQLDEVHRLRTLSCMT